MLTLLTDVNVDELNPPKKSSYITCTTARTLLFWLDVAVLPNRRNKALLFRFMFAAVNPSHRGRGL